MPYDLPKDCIYVQQEPVLKGAQYNELLKRNAGLAAVKQLGFSHFIMMDADEFYEPSEFKLAKTSIELNNYAGSVCMVKTYFKSPGLTIGYDHTLVPFIHKVTSRLEYKLGYANYPYTYYESKQARIDPTRRLNIYKGVELFATTMHHYSYVRQNMALKLENSSANFAGNRSDVVLEDLRNARPGYHCKSYNRTLEACENIFNLPEYELL